MGGPPAWRLRAAGPGDGDLLLAVYASTRAAELALVAWDEATKRAFVEQQYAAQDTHYRAHYPGAAWQVIEAGGEPAGRLIVHRGERDIRVMDISLLPAHRARGLGTAILGELAAEADAAQRRLSIHVEHTNPARRLYERLGFVAVETGEVYVLMERPPVS
jgi:ribosomal protein S18 acetylase RimI-like enzyme